ncbi:MAG: helix-turn-helix transcriptional regulator [Blastocatellia bacterium]|nr:helix-turn-helix transcriptional regulator [Blastocatellia bacterium]
MSWQWRIRSKSASYLSPYEAQVLVKECGINVPERNSNRACERLEKALDRLLDDKIISNWQYADWNWDNAKKQGWIKNWLATKIVIEPPELVQDSYQSIGQNIDKARLIETISNTTPTDFAEQVKLKRKELKLSQMELAEIIGVSQPTISRLENGKSIEAAEKKQVERWLSS